MFFASYSIFFEPGFPWEPHTHTEKVNCYCDFLKILRPPPQQLSKLTVPLKHHREVVLTSAGAGGRPLSSHPVSASSGVAGQEASVCSSAKRGRREVPARGALSTQWRRIHGGSLPAAGVAVLPPGSRRHSPEAVPVVQLALGQVALHQVHVLPAGCARAAGRPVGALLRRAPRGERLALRGTGWAGCGWARGRQPSRSPHSRPLAPSHR